MSVIDFLVVGPIDSYKHNIRVIFPTECRQVDFHPSRVASGYYPTYLLGRDYYELRRYSSYRDHNQAPDLLSLMESERWPRTGTR